MESVKEQVWNWIENEAWIASKHIYYKLERKNHITVGDSIILLMEDALYDEETKDTDKPSKESMGE